MRQPRVSVTLVDRAVMCPVDKIWKTEQRYAVKILDDTGNIRAFELSVAEAGLLHTSLTDVLEAPDRDGLLTWLRHRPMLYHEALRKR